MPDPAAKPLTSFGYQDGNLREFEHFWIINSADLGAVGTLAAVDLGGSLIPLTGLVVG